METNPYTTPSNPSHQLLKKSKLALASLILSWCAWIPCVFYWLGVTAISIMPDFIASDPPVTSESLYVVITQVVLILLPVGLLIVRKKCWVNKKIGWGYLVFLIPLYISVLLAIVAPTLGFFMENTQGVLFRFGFIATLVVVVMSFPRLPHVKEVAQ